MAARSKHATAPELILTREFDAPRALVFRCWTEPKHIMRWLAPHGFTIPQAVGELKPGGYWRSCMVKPDGTELWLGGTYREVIPDELLVMTHAWEQPDGRPGPTTIITVRLEDLGNNRTRMVFIQTGFDSLASRDGHADGWSQCFERLDELLPLIS